MSVISLIVIPTILFILISSCSTEDKKVITLFDTLKPDPIIKEKLDPQYEKYRQQYEWLKASRVNIISNEGITFEYEIIDTIHMYERRYFVLECSIKNTTSKEINYIRHSDTGLQSFLEVLPSDYMVEPSLIGNSFSTLISKLKSNSTYKFKTNLRASKGIQPLERIGINLKVVDTYIPDDTLREHYEYVISASRQEMSKDNIIWSK